jgi:hypothetical protein
MSSSGHRANLALEHERVAQLVEHRPFKALVLGSSPSPLTTTSPRVVKPPSLCKTHKPPINTGEINFKNRA